MPCCPLAGILHTHGTVLCPDLVYRTCGVGFPKGRSSLLVIDITSARVELINEFVSHRNLPTDRADLYHRAVLQFLAVYNEKRSLSECAQN